MPFLIIPRITSPSLLFASSTSPLRPRNIGLVLPRKDCIHRSNWVFIFLVAMCLWYSFYRYSAPFSLDICTLKVILHGHLLYLYSAPIDDLHQNIDAVTTLTLRNEPFTPSVDPCVCFKKNGRHRRLELVLRTRFRACWDPA